jgi:peptide methionine sulfoxide reductase MsrB
MAFRQPIDQPASWRVELHCDTCHTHIGTLRGDTNCDVTAQRLCNMAAAVQDNHVCYTGLEEVI